MKSFNRFTILMLILVMVVSMFALAGCGREDPTLHPDGENNSSTEADADNAVAEAEDGYLRASESDFNQLEKMLNDIYTLHFSDFDYETATPGSVIATLVPGFDAPGYEYFFGEVSANDPSTDPQGRFDCGDYEFPAENMNWIVENIFNVEITGDIDNDMMYYEGDTCYVAANYDEYVGPYPVVDSSERQADGTYKIQVIYKYDPAIFTEGEPDGLDIVTAGLKNIDGKKYWTLFKIERVS